MGDIEKLEHWQEQSDITFLVKSVTYPGTTDKKQGGQAIIA